MYCDNELWVERDIQRIKHYVRDRSKVEPEKVAFRYAMEDATLEMVAGLYPGLTTLPDFLDSKQVWYPMDLDDLSEECHMLGKGAVLKHGSEQFEVALESLKTFVLDNAVPDFSHREKFVSALELHETALEDGGHNGNIEVLEYTRARICTGEVVHSSGHTRNRSRESHSIRLSYNFDDTLVPHVAIIRKLVKVCLVDEVLSGEEVCLRGALCDFYSQECIKEVEDNDTGNMFKVELKEDGSHFDQKHYWVALNTIDSKLVAAERPAHDRQRKAMYYMGYSLAAGLTE